MTAQARIAPTGSVLIELGWPAKALSPNFRSRSHWPKTKALAAAKSEAFYAARSVVGPGYMAANDKQLKLVLTAYPPTKRNRDADNMLASLKGHLDGIALALGVDDSIFDPRVQFGKPVKGGKIVVEVAA